MAERSDLTREINFDPAFDRRHPEPSKNYGIHNVEMIWILKGPLGAIQFKVDTGWYLPHVRRELAAKHRHGEHDPFEPRAWDLGYHAPEPQYENQSRMKECHILEQSYCYYDGSTLNAKPVLDLLLREGHEPVWKKLESYYAELFEGEPEKVGS